MSETKHTPGPWSCADLGDENNPWSSWSVYHNGPLCHGGDGCATTSENESNARLIAAAPDLLEALHGLLNIEGAAVIGGRCKALAGLDVQYHFDKARAAVAKAEGLE